MSESSRVHATLSSSQAVPAAVRAVASALAAKRFEAWLVGESLHALCSGRAPAAFELSTSATLDQCLDLFPHAVVTNAARGIATVATPGAAIDLVPFQRGSSIEEELAGRDFTIHAMALEPTTGRLVDPHGGQRDLDRELVRCVGDAATCVARDPLRALRAARLVAAHGYQVDDALEAVMPALGPRMKELHAGRARSELVRMLLGQHPSRGIRLLRRTGLEQRFFKPVREDSADLVDDLPPVLHLRMVGWLRGARTSRMLRHLRFGIDRSRQIEQLLAHHPLDERVAPGNDRSLSRMLRVLSRKDIDALFRMRAWELDRQPSAADAVGTPNAAASRARLAAIARGLDRVLANRERVAQRTQLALDGEQIMQLLACPPGRQVGAAIRHLADFIRVNSALNTKDDLRRELLGWAKREPGPGGAR